MIKGTRSIQLQSALYLGSNVTLLFEHSPSRASEIEHFEIFSCPEKTN